MDEVRGSSPLRSTFSLRCNFGWYHGKVFSSRWDGGLFCLLSFWVQVDPIGLPVLLKNVRVFQWHAAVLSHRSITFDGEWRRRTRVHPHFPPAIPDGSYPMALCFLTYQAHSSAFAMHFYRKRDDRAH